MPRQADEYAVHLFLSNGFKEEVRFPSIQEFQKWYSNDLIPRYDSQEFINVPMKNAQGEFMVLRPCNIIAIRVEPIFFGSVERE